MVNFIAVDLVLLFLFSLFLGIFLYTNRKNLGTEGGLILYRAQWGVKLINYIGKKYKKTLKFLSYVSVVLGYVLMIGILTLIFQTVYLYLTTPIAKVIRAPPIVPLIPYFPQLFGLESFFPPFYFTYFIVAIIIVATLHEFSHGIFARRYGIKIKSTGFAFLKYFPAIFGAFVEQDDKQMNKKKKFEQMAVLSAGVFANLIVTLLFFLLFIGFFNLAFTPAGVSFDSYSYSAVSLSSIVAVNGQTITNANYENVLSLLNETRLNKIQTTEEKYVSTKEFFVSQNETNGKIILYEDTPAVNADLGGIIQEINGIKITSVEKLSEELMKYNPGDKIKIKSIKSGGVAEDEIILAKNPSNGKAFLGIGFIEKTNKGVISKVYVFISGFKKENVYYESKYEFSVFVYDLIWWIIIINLLVALFNMLPFGFLDGGKFFYLTILGITKSKRIAEKSFSWITYFLFFLLIVLMVKWAFGFF
ncbi:MAG: site-2 protease family protein [Candidatus Pacearchaeota archaeon]